MMRSTVFRMDRHVSTTKSSLISDFDIVEERIEILRNHTYKTDINKRGGDIPQSKNIDSVQNDCSHSEEEMKVVPAIKLLDDHTQSRVKEVNTIQKVSEVANDRKLH